MSYKFEKLDVWNLALNYADLIYEISSELPKNETHNLITQINRAATSVALNIAEGSTGQTNAEQARFLGMAIRSLIETVACQHLINRRNYLSDKEKLKEAYRQSKTLAAKLHTMRRVVREKPDQLREDSPVYLVETDE